MGLLEALENFADNLPHALGELKDLRKEFKKDFGALAREGAELFTVGFEEMVIKDNNDWKSSYEYLQQARQMVSAARAASAAAPRHLAAIERLQTAIDNFEKEQGECWEAMSELLELLDTAKQDELPEVQWESTLRRILRGVPGRVGLVATNLAEIWAHQAYAIALVEHGLDGPYKIKSSGTESCNRASIQEDQAAAACEYAAAQAIAADTTAIAALLERDADRMTSLAVDFERCVGQLTIIKQEWMTASNRIENLRNRGEAADEMAEQLRQRSVVVSEVLHGEVYDRDIFSLKAAYCKGLERLLAVTAEE